MDGVGRVVKFLGGWENAGIAFLALLNGGSSPASSAWAGPMQVGIELAATPVGWFIGARR